jgi:hypothetical protein
MATIQSQETTESGGTESMGGSIGPSPEMATSLADTFSGIVGGIQGIINTQTMLKQRGIDAILLRNEVRLRGKERGLEMYAKKKRLTLDEARQHYEIAMNARQASMSGALSARQSRLQAGQVATSNIGQMQNIKAKQSQKNNNQAAGLSYLKGIAGAFTSGTESPISMGA